MTDKEKILLINVYDLMYKMDELQKQRFIGIGEGLVMQAEFQELAQKSEIAGRVVGHESVPDM